ncbi:MAG: ArsR family transcriptional regulator [Hyphomicrobiaceae bacterium]|nr:ArsR family transcriptional regulator [Hyphomicrobiaceae bacterium]
MDEIEAAQGLSALGNKTRLSVFRLLVRAGRDGTPVGHIGRNLGIPLSTLAHHLDRLSRAGLVDQQKSGREVICTANYKALLALTNYLTEKCCEGLPDDSFASTIVQSPELAES